MEEDTEFFDDIIVGELRQVGGALTEMEASGLSCPSFSLSNEIICVCTFFFCFCFAADPTVNVFCMSIKIISYVEHCSKNSKIILPGIVDDIIGSDKETFCFSISFPFKFRSNSSLSILIANKILPSPNSQRVIVLLYINTLV